MTAWGRRARRGGRWARQTARTGGERILRVASRVPAEARKAGQLLARQVIGVQLSAGLGADRKIPFLPSTQEVMRDSAQSAISQRHGPGPSEAWRQGYRDMAVATVPGLAPEPPPAAPRWPDAPSQRDDPDREAGA